MKLTEKTRKILSNFSEINESILFVKGKVQKTMPIQRTVLAVATLDEDFPQEFGVYYFSKFLQILSLFKEPELTFDDKMVTFTENDVSATYTYCDAKLIKGTPPKDKDVVQGNVVVSYSLSEEVLAEAKKAASILGNDDMVIEGDGTSIMLNIRKNGDSSADTFSRKIGDTSETFKYSFDVTTLKILPSKYDVQIDDKGMAKYSSTDWNVVYWIPTQKI